MSTKRSDIEISASILQVAMNDAKKSHIIYKANVNFKIGKKYLDRLITYGLLQGPKSENRVFRTTKKGADYINYFKSFKEYLNLQEIAFY